MTKIPAFQFYPGDWRRDIGVQSLGYFERGVWFEMLCLMHESEERGKLILNGQPMTEDVLARLLGLDKQNLTTVVNLLLDRRVASRDDVTGAIFCRRMVKDENLRKIRASAGKKGGNPVLLNQISNHRPKQNPTPSSSSSLSSSPSGKGEGAPPQAPSFSPGANGELMLAQELGKEIKLAMRTGDVALVAQVIANESTEHGGVLEAKNFIRDRALEARARGEPVTVFWLQDRRFIPTRRKDVYQQFMESDA